MDYLSKTAVILVAFIAATGVAAADLDVSSASADPATIEEGQTVDNQVFELVVDGVAADGDTDHVYFQFPELTEAELSPNSVDSNISVEESAELTDYNEDGEQRTVVAGLAEDNDGENITVNATLDISVDYPETLNSTTVDIKYNSSQGEEAAETVTVTAEAEEQEESDEETTQDEETTEDDDSQDESEDESEEETTQDEETTEDESDESDTNETTGQQEDGSQEDEETTEDDTETETDGGLIDSVVSFFEDLF